VNRAAVWADTQFFVAVKVLEKRRQVLNDAFQKNFGAINKMVALFAIPLEAVFLTISSWHFNDQADCSVRVALRRMTHMSWQQKDFALFDRDFDGRLSRGFHYANKNVALKLVEEFFGWIIVIIDALIGPSYDGDDHVAIVPNLRISDGRFQFVAVRVDPGLEIKGLQRFYGRHDELLYGFASGL
jgi:hypothetical protein